MPFDAKLRFQALCKSAADQIRTDQANISTKVLGAIVNRAKRIRSQNGMAVCGPVIGKAITFGIAHVPFVGPVLSTLIDAALTKASQMAANKGLNNLMASNVADMGDSAKKLQQKGVLLFETVAPTYLDAIRKYEESREAASKAMPKQFKNCTEIGAYLKTVYYWGYRMNRLRAHHDQIMAYCKTVDQYLSEAEKSFFSYQAEMQAKGPTMFDDWRWHYANCTDDCCYWPEDFGQEIGSPTNSAEIRQDLINHRVQLSAPTGFKTYPNGVAVMVNPVPPKPELRPPATTPHPPIRQGANRNLIPPDKNRRG